MQLERDDLYERLIAAHQEAFAGGFYETAYHILAAALHRAQDLGSEDLLATVEQLALQDLDVIDQHAPIHILSSQQASLRATNPLYKMLANQAATRQKLLRTQLNRRTPQDT